MYCKSLLRTKLPSALKLRRTSRRTSKFGMTKVDGLRFFPGASGLRMTARRSQLKNLVNDKSCTEQDIDAEART